MRRVGIAAAMGAFGLWAISAGALTKTAPADPKVDEEIESMLPALEAARVEGKLAELHTRYADRTDRAGQVLAAWSLQDDQAMWNALKPLGTFDHPEPWVDVGQAEVYVRWKTFDQAAVALQRAHANAPKLAAAYVVEGDLNRAQGNAAAAQAAYEKALSLRPNEALAQDGLGRLALAAHQIDEAERHFTAARAIFADDPVAAAGQEEARLGHGDVAGALKALDDQHRLVPLETDPWLRSGKLKLKQGDQSGAATDFEAARKLGSSDPELLKLLSASYKTQGRGDDERRLLDDLISQGSATEVQYARRAELRQGSDPRGALADLRKAVELSKGDPTLVLQLAALTAQTGDLAAAIGLYRGVVAKKPEAKAALDQLSERCSLSRRPLKGNISQVNTALGSELNRLYHQLLKTQPDLGGSLKLRVSVNDKGAAEAEEWLDDTVKSPELTANLQWNAHDAHYPAQSARYVLKFQLAP